MTRKTAFAASAVIFLTLSQGPVTQAANSAVMRTLIGVDTSGSSAYLFDQSAADEAASYITSYISGLSVPHDIRLVSVGDAGMARRLIDIKFQVTNRRKTKPRVAARYYGELLKSLPAETGAGNIAPHNTTSIISFLYAAKRYCKDGGRIIIFTDGAEWSSDVDGQAFIAGTVKLPRPENEFLKGCHVEMHGIGNLKSSLRSDGLERRLVPQWESYLTAAGASSVVVNGSFFD